jgi:hypothetical protein
MEMSDRGQRYCSNKRMNPGLNGFSQSAPNAFGKLESPIGRAG